MTLGGVATILTIVFVCLKISGVIAWSWWLVFLPVIIWLVIAVLILASVVLYAIAEYRRMSK